MAALLDYQILDTPVERVFDEIVAAAAECCEAPCTMISLVDRDRVWFKARYGLDLCEIGRQESFCAHAILEREFFEVPDLQRDERFAGNPLLAGPLRTLRSYAAAPLTGRGGHHLGVLAVMDVRPRRLSPAQRETLRQLARVVVTLFEGHRQRRRQEWLAALVERISEEVTVIDIESHRYLYANAAALAQLGRPLEELQRLTPMELRPELHREQFLAHLRQLQQGAPQVMFEDRRRRRDGSLYPVEVRWQLLESSAGPLLVKIAHDLSDHKAAEASLARSEARFARLLENTNEGYLRVSRGRRIAEVNPALCRMTGFTKEELLGCPLASLLPVCPLGEVFEPEDRSDVTSLSTQAVMQHRDGQRVHVLMNATIERNDEGAPVSLDAFLHDVTEQRRTERRLHALSEENRRLVDNSPDLICTIDCEGRIRRVNQAGCAMLDYGEQEMVGRRWEEFVHPDDLAASRAAFLELKQRGEVRYFENRCCKKEGQAVSLSWTCNWSAEEGLAYAMARDITEQHRAREELRRAHEHLEALLGSIEDAFFAIDRDFRVTYFNAALLPWLETREAELIGRHLFLELRPDLQGTVFEQKYREVMATRRSVQFEAFFEPRGLWLWVRAYPLSDGGMAVLLSDITQRKSFEKMKDDFIGVVNHELRTPLTSVHGAIRLLESGVGGELPEGVARLVRLASLNAERMRRIIDDILDLEKVASGRMEFRIAPIEAEPFLRQLAFEHAATADSAGVRLSVEVPQRLRLLADELRLQQVLGNLVSNALKFAPPGSTVELRACREGERVRLSVTDRGPGIPEHFRPKLFQRFAQAEMGNTRSQGGSGLGLAIVRQMTEQMGGRVGCESRPGCTTFHVELPEAAP